MTERPEPSTPSRALRYADVFPGRVDPLDDPTYRAQYIASREAGDIYFRTTDEDQYPLKDAA